MTITSHTVHFNLQGLSEENISTISNEVAKLAKLPIFGILGFTGLQQADDTMEVELGLRQDFTHSFRMTFCTKAHRDYYLPHPIHQEAVSRLIDAGLKADPSGVLALDADENLPAAVAQSYIVLFAEAHDLSLFEAIDKVDEANVREAARAEVKAMAENYSRQDLSNDQKAFWDGLKSTAEYAV